MNYALFLGIINLVLLGRLRLIQKDRPIRWKDALVIGGIPLLVLPFFKISIAWFFLLLYLALSPALMKKVEERSAYLNRDRGLILLLHFLVIGLLCSPVSNLGSSGLAEYTMQFFEEVMFPGSDITKAGANILQTILFGFLLVLNEANILLRYLLRLLGLQSLGNEGEEVDQDEYNTGRVIGLLERLFVVIFVLMGQYAAIGFILAAKGVARFQDFKSRTFAEYVLIGTLLSTLLAMIVGFAVKAVVT